MSKTVSSPAAILDFSFKLFIFIFKFILSAIKLNDRI